MIEIVNPGWLALVVDGGRFGSGDIGVPASCPLDRFAFDVANYLTGNATGTPLLEVIGGGFAVEADTDIACAITGAKVTAFVDDEAVAPWTGFTISRGSRLAVKGVREGFRYYVGFSGRMAADEVMGSCTTNLECRFGGFKGRSLMRGDVLMFEGIRVCESPGLPREKIPEMEPPHVLRMIGGPEIDHFTAESLEGVFSGEKRGDFIVSARLNRTGISLEGSPLAFRCGAQKSITSEGILPGTVQIPGDGLPIIGLYERTIGGYARLGVIAAADRNRLAHLKPGDSVRFELVTLEQARELRLSQPRFSI